MQVLKEMHAKAITAAAAPGHTSSNIMNNSSSSSSSPGPLLGSKASGAAPPVDLVESAMEVLHAAMGRSTQQRACAQEEAPPQEQACTQERAEAAGANAMGVAVRVADELQQGHYQHQQQYQHQEEPHHQQQKQHQQQHQQEQKYHQHQQQEQYHQIHQQEHYQQQEQQYQREQQEGEYMDEDPAKQEREQRAEDYYEKWRVRKHRPSSPDYKWSQAGSDGPVLAVKQQVFCFDAADPSHADQHYLRTHDQNRWVVDLMVLVGSIYVWSWIVYD